MSENDTRATSLCVKSHLSRKARAASCASSSGGPSMLADVSSSKAMRIGPGPVTSPPSEGGNPSHERSSGTGSTVISSALPVSRWTARTWTTPFAS
jgi:hypothetical protein